MSGLSVEEGDKRGEGRREKEARRGWVKRVQGWSLVFGLGVNAVLLGRVLLEAGPSSFLVNCITLRRSSSRRSAVSSRRETPPVFCSRTIFVRMRK